MRANESLDNNTCAFVGNRPTTHEKEITKNNNIKEEILLMQYGNNISVMHFHTLMTSEIITVL